MKSDPVRILSPSIGDEKSRIAVRQLEQLLGDALSRIGYIEDALSDITAASSGGSDVTLPIDESDVTGLVTDLAGKAATSHNHVKADVTDFAHTHAEADVTNLASDLADKVPSSRTITATSPLRIDGGASADLSANRTLSISLPSIVNALLLGTGAGGTVTFDGAATVLGLVPAANIYTMTRDIFADNVTINGGVTLKTASYRLFVRGTLTNDGTISATGGNGGTSAGGTGASTGVYIGNLSGAAGGTPGGTGNSSTSAWDYGSNSDSSVVNRGAIGANGTGGDVPFRGGGGGGAGATNAGGSGGNVARPAATNGSADFFSMIAGHPTNTTTRWTAGSGGGGGGTNGGGGGGGGAGGNSMYIGCSVWAGSGAIESKGGNGGNGAGTSPNSGGGGGGGGGGFIFIAYGTKTGTNTVSVAGGTGGTGGTGAGNGGNGADGYYYLLNLSGDGT